MKKKTLTLLLFMLVFTGAWAGDVSPEQALQQAKTFQLLEQIYRFFLR